MPYAVVGVYHRESFQLAFIAVIGTVAIALSQSLWAGEKFVTG